MNRKQFSLLLGFSLFAISLVTSTSILAQNIVNLDESTSSADNNDDEIKENIKQRIENAVKKSIADGSIPRAYVGTLAAITDQSISVVIENQTEIIAIDENSVIQNEDFENITPEDLSLGSSLVITSNSSNLEKLKAESIILLDEAPIKSLKQTLLASVTAVDTRSNTIEVTSLLKSEAFVLEVTKESSLSGRLSQSKLSIKDLNAFDKIVTIFLPNEDDNEILTLDRVFNASPSAEVND